MPVLTRSGSISHEQNGPSSDQRTRRSSYSNQEDTHFSVPLRNPHHGSKEKKKAFTLLYEQQKKAYSTLRNSSPNPGEKRFSTYPSVDLLNGGKREEKDPKKTKGSEQKNVTRENTMLTLPGAKPNSTITRTFVLPEPPIDDSKENLVMGLDRVIGFSTCPRKANRSSTVARKLSMGSSEPHAEPRRFLGSKLVQENEMLETVSEKNGPSGSRILVFVRLRPMAKKEREAGLRCSVRIVNRRDVYLTEFANENDYLRLKRLRGRHFTFDAAFPDSTSQQEVYSTTTSELVEQVLRGRNGSVFCYGATGAGKTYTMLGTVENPGVMVLAIKDLFTKIRQRSCDGSQVHLSYLEVYNETVRDLLSPGRPLVLREDKQGIVAAGLTQYRAYSTDEVMALLQQGNQNRTTEPTRANQTSSRSHAILQVVVEYRVRDASMNVVHRVGKLSLIDLALLAQREPLQLIKEHSDLLRVCEIHEEIQIPESETDQAKLLLEVQKENCELHVQLAHQQQKLLSLQAQLLASNTSPTPPSVTSLQTPPSAARTNEKRKTRTSFLGGNCFTPESRKKGAEEAVRELQNTVKQKIERMKKDHAIQLKQKDDRILELSRKSDKSIAGVTGGGAKRVVTRGTLRPKETNIGELKSPSHRFKSPIATAKKRSFWDITTANSPSVATLNDRKSRSHVIADNTPAAPSMLLQPGFARQIL